MTDMTWDGINPTTITGAGSTPTDNGSGGLTTGLASAVTTASGSNPPLYSPQNPLFWLGALLAGAALLVKVSAHSKTSISAHA